jgi:hypothetical protein
MNTSRILAPILVATLMASAAFAQSPASSPNAAALPSDSPKSAIAAPVGQDQAELMKQMMEMAKLGENHKLLADLAGTWNYTVKFWPAPGAPPQESKGISTTKAMMGGRYFVTDVAGKIKMPGVDGKMKDADFKGMGVDGYDNAKKKFVGTWQDNMGTGIMMSEGDYDAATKTFTYTSEIEMVPGMKQKIRETVKITDKDHHIFEWYENRNGQEAKTMEISYTRKK